jgi:hypothetical protein
VRRPDPEANKITVLEYFCPLYLDQRRLRLFFIRLTERPEVVLADEHFRRLFHRRRVELVLYPPNEIFRQRRPPGRYLIQIIPGDRVMARVKIVGSVRHLQDIYVVRQHVVEPVLDLFRRDVHPQFGNLQMSDLPQSVDAGVGSS